MSVSVEPVPPLGPAPEAAAPRIAGLDEAALADVLAQSASDAERADRLGAFERYAAAPVPHRRMEEWRRTDPARIPFGSVRRLPLVQPGSCAPHPWDEACDLVLALEDDRFTVFDRLGLLVRGEVKLQPLAEALAEGVIGSDRLAEWGRRPDVPDQVALAPEPFWNAGFYLRVEPSARVPRGVLLRYHLRRVDALAVLRLVVELAPGAALSAVEWHESSSGRHLTLASKRWLIGERARLHWTVLRDEGAQTVHVADEWASLRRDARFDWITLNFGGQLIKARLTGDARAPGAAAELDGLYFVNGDGHVDQKTLQVHSAPDTFSRLLYKGAVKDRGFSMYQGQIIARPGAIRVDAYQKNNNLVLNDGARADSMPGLQIDADDLKCSHGATIGALDPDQLFYLRSRGLDERTARALLIRGFFEDVASRILHERVRERLQQRIEEKMK